MKTLKILSIIALIAFFTTNVNAQLLKKLGKAAERAAERTLEKKVEEKLSKETEKAFDTVFNNKKGNARENEQRKSNKTSKDESILSIPGIEQTKGENDLDIYSKFDFVPGDKIMMVDDFSLDNMGDFPSKWNTNGTGELVTIDQEKWFKLAGKSTYIPDLHNALPEDYTIEFDMLVVVDKKTSSEAKLEILLEDNNLFDNPKDMAKVEIPLCLFISRGFVVENRIANNRVIRNAVEKDIRDILLKKNHISIAVNGKRYRMWVNENKVVDVPRLLPKNIVSFKIYPRSVRDGIDKIFINNVKIAQGGIDLRKQLLENGKFSTTGILFNSGSDQIKPESYGILKQISDALQQDKTLNLNIIGHTDSDGNNGQNLSLSEKRSISVKNILVSQFNIDSNRLQSQGKGETEPVDKNTTTEGKANNRRVEFVKI